VKSLFEKKSQVLQAETQKYMNKDFDETLYNQRNTNVGEIIQHELETYLLLPLEDNSNPVNLVANVGRTSLIARDLFDCTN
ncbi:26517_t:CDS:2, partial [Gigaspora margarita]